MSINDLAGGGVVGTFSPEQLFAGEMPIHTDTAKTAVSDVLKYELLYLADNNLLRRVDPATDEPHRCVIAAQPVPVSGSDCPYYDGGKFNHEIVVWPASLNTYALRKAFLAGCNLQVKDIPFTV